MKKIPLPFFFILVLLGACNQKPLPELVRSDFGMIEGERVELLTITFPQKLEAKVTNYGGIITSLSVPDKNGVLEDVVLGYDDLQSYLEETPYFGALIGRFGNRIERGEFTLDSVVYTLATNNGVNHLHGGVKGFDKVIWNIEKAEIVEESIQITLSYLSVDGEEGYPGNLDVRVVYTFTEKGLLINYEAKTDKRTVINLTQHSYFNLAGDAKEDILDQELQISASQFLPVDSTLIPTGELRAVAGTPFDFTKPKLIGKEIEKENLQLTYGLGYDHCWVLDSGITKKRREIGSLYHPGNGRYMQIFTVEPALQFYSGNFLDGSITGKGGVAYQHRYGMCLETQHYPDSPNQPDFPSVVLNPGEKYETSTEYRFSVK